ncbi:MAG: BrnT family toxin [Rhodospirillaceae bacterium]|nr:BrnT family toxin [Rhodospirillaceae bacterium]
MNYEWDLAKAAANRLKHKVDFVDAIAALEDERRVEQVDTRFSYAEERVRVVGRASRALLFVVFTMRGDDTCRIIMARKATRREKERYLSADDDAW